MKKIVILLSILLSFSLVLYTQKKTNSIGVAFYRYDDSYMKYLKKYIEKNIKNKNTSLLMVDSYNSQSTQNAQIEMLLKKNVNILAVNLVDKSQAQKVIDKISVKNVPIVFFNKEPSFDAMNTYDRAWYIGGTSEEAGNAQGRVIAESWNKRPNWDKNQDDKIQCVIIKGDLNDTDTINRTEYMKKYVASNNIKLDILSEVSAEGKRASASKVMENLITKYGEKIRVVTMAKSFKKFYASRAYEIYDENNEKIVEGEGIFLLINIDRRRAVRIPEDQYIAYGVDIENCPDIKLNKLEKLTKEMDKNNFKVRYGDIDSNMHVNNVKYVEWAVESLPLDIVLNYELKELSVVFEKECRYGAEISASYEIKENEDEEGLVILHKIADTEGKELTVLISKWKKLMSN